LCVFGHTVFNGQLLSNAVTIHVTIYIYIYIYIHTVPPLLHVDCCRGNLFVCDHCLEMAVHPTICMVLCYASRFAFLSV
jgi:hypothetical protein